MTAGVVASAFVSAGPRLPEQDTAAAAFCLLVGILRDTAGSSVFLLGSAGKVQAGGGGVTPAVYHYVLLNVEHHRLD